MTKRRRALPLLLAMLLLVFAGVSAGIWFTSSPDEPTKAPKAKQSSAPPPLRVVVDQQPLQTIQQLQKLATTREESRLARQAFRTADHFVDVTFAAALREIQGHPPAQNPETKPYYDRVRDLETQLQQDEDLVQKLNDSFAASKGAQADELLQQLPLAEAELVLRQGELEDAKQALRRAGGDPESRIQQLFAQHQAAYHRDQDPTAAPPPNFETFQVPGTMVAQFQLWRHLRQTRQQVQEAQRQTVSAAALLEAKRGELAAQIQQISQSNVVTKPGLDSAGYAAADAAFDRIAEERKSLAEFDERIQDEQQLAATYGEWSSLLTGRMRACVHGLLQSFRWILLIVLCVMVVNLVLGKVTMRAGWDRRRVATMRLLAQFVVQAAGLLLILFVLLGSPSQLSTIIAFAGAGLTVALKDFIVAFLGWFVLMGKNGIHVGDWVEINGISGEVVEIGLLRTVLLETGNWADSGHPTGRRVTFVNSFAIEGHYFNFSTTGQWLWDSLEILVPAGQDPYAITDAILKLVLKETEATARQAEQEWQRATQPYGVKSFSAVPAINLRPTFQGINIVVRYIARANERYEIRTRLYASVVELLQHRNIALGDASAPERKATEVGQPA